MTKQLPTTPENIREVLLNSGFRQPIALDNCYEIEKDGIQLTINKLTINKNRDQYFIQLNFDNFDKFLSKLESIYEIKPLEEESILEWWEKNKVKGFELEFAGYRISNCWELFKDGISMIYIPSDWNDARIKSTILKLCELYKD